MEAELSFEAAFGPLAQHFFPDGCPVAVTLDCPSREAHDLQHVWPHSTSRVAVSPAMALESMVNLRRYAMSRGGLHGPEMVAIGYLASMATRPTVATDGASEPVDSTLLDGTTELFCSLVQCLLPRYSDDDEEYSSWMIVVRQLVSSCCGSGLDGSEMAKARRCVLHFLCRLVQCSPRPIQWSLSSPHVIPTIYQWALQLPTTTDALRVIWFSEASIPEYRLRQIRALLRRIQQEQREKKSLQGHGPLAIEALTDVLQRYDTSSHLIEPFHHAATWLHIADRNGSWKHGPLHVNNEAMNDVQTSSRRLANESMQRGSRSSKRQRPLRKAIDLESVVSRIRGTFLTTSDVPEAVLCRSLYVASSASELLDDAYIRYLHCMARQSSTSLQDNRSGIVFQRLSVVLSHRLSEQWHQRSQQANGSTINESSRLMLLESIHEFGQIAQSLPNEVEEFFLRDILSSWDGEREGEFGRSLLAIVPFLRPPQSPHSFQQLIQKGQERDGVGQVFCHLKRLFLCGSNWLRHVIVSGALAGLVYRWGIMFDQSSDDSDAEWKSNLLVTICQWTDDLVLPEGPCLVSFKCNELWFAAVIEFYQTVVDLYHDVDKPPHQLAIPSPALVSRLWVTSSETLLDIACKLLLEYNGLVREWKDLNEVHNGCEKTNAGRLRVEAYEQCVRDYVQTVWPESAPQLDAVRKDSTCGTDTRNVNCAQSNKLEFLEYLTSRDLLGIHGLLSEFVDQTLNETIDVDHSDSLDATRAS